MCRVSWFKDRNHPLIGYFNNYLLFHTNNKNMWLSKNIDYFILEANSAKRFVIGYFNNYLLFHTNNKNMWLSKKHPLLHLRGQLSKAFCHKQSCIHKSSGAIWKTGFIPTPHWITDGWNTSFPTNVCDIVNLKNKQDLLILKSHAHWEQG